MSTKWMAQAGRFNKSVDAGMMSPLVSGHHSFVI
jgi:hypothetical protein